VKQYRVEYTNGAQIDLKRLHVYITRVSSEERADIFIEKVMTDCESLTHAPQRGRLVPAFGDGVRLIGSARKRASILFRVKQSKVTIVAVHYAGHPHRT